VVVVRARHRDHHESVDPRQVTGLHVWIGRSLEARTAAIIASYGAPAACVPLVAATPRPVSRVIQTYDGE
jgi:hypothetical protein